MIHAVEEFGVLLVGEAVGRNMLRLEINGLAQAVFPLGQTLAWNSIDKVEVEIVVTGGT